MVQRDPKAGRINRDRHLFDRVADRYATKDLQSAMRSARRRRVLATWKQARIERVGHLLEVGCGAGFAAAYLSGRYGRFTGIDYSSELISHARQLHDLDRADFLVADAMTFEPDEAPDAILVVGVLHHMPGHAAALEHLWRILSPGGILMVNEPQSRNVAIELARALRARMDTAYSDEQRPYRRGELEGLVEAAGFEGIRSVGQGLLSTPLAEVRLPMQNLLRPVSWLAVHVDSFVEARLQLLVRPMAWNVVVTARKPAARVEDGSVTE